MTAVSETLRKFLKDDGGATATEYALIAGIISVSIVLGLTSVRNDLGAVFASVSAGFN